LRNALQERGSRGGWPSRDLEKSVITTCTKNGAGFIAIKGFDELERRGDFPRSRVLDSQPITLVRRFT
jgi:hypothetical protein